MRKRAATRCWRLVTGDWQRLTGTGSADSSTNRASQPVPSPSPIYVAYQRACMPKRNRRPWRIVAGRSSALPKRLHRGEHDAGVQRVVGVGLRLERQPAHPEEPLQTDVELVLAAEELGPGGFSGTLIDDCVSVWPVRRPEQVAVDAPDRAQRRILGEDRAVVQRRRSVHRAVARVARVALERCR